jgi:hypothetical protein
VALPGTGMDHLSLRKIKVEMPTPPMIRPIGGPMRFFFNTHDKLRIEDELGREFAGPSEAVIFAKHLAADLRCLETAVRPALAIEVTAENAGCIHRELVF